MPTTLLLQLLHTSATWKNWNTYQTALSMNYGFGQTQISSLLMRKRKLVPSVERILRVLLAYIFFFFQEINDSLKNLLFYPFQFTDR